MESQYNQLLAKSKTVSAFYENVYAPVLQTLPWIDDGNGLKTASEKVLGNIAFPAWELSTYKNQPEDQKTINTLRARCDQLDAIYKQMQDELQPVLNMIPNTQDRTWKNLQAMVPQWKNLTGPKPLPDSMHKAVEDSFALSPNVMPVTTSRRRTLAQPDPAVQVSSDEGVLGKLMAEKIKSLHAKGDSDHTIAVTFGSHGFWLGGHFLNSLR
ncbi:hypothetical protein ACROYT_G000027 [Oculina patagonica]